MALTDNLIAHWSLNENGLDSHGSHDCAVVGDPGYMQGLIRQNGHHLLAPQMTGSPEIKFVAADHDDLSYTGEDFTLAAWVRLGSTNTQGIISKDSASDNREWTLNWTSGVFRFVAYPANGTSIGFTGRSPTVATIWNLCFAWYNASENKIYFQLGETFTGLSAISSTALSGNMVNSTSTFNIGATPSAGTNMLSFGNVQSVSFWKRILSTSEREDLLNGLAFGVGYPFVSAFTENEYPADSYGGSIFNIGFSRNSTIASIELSGTRYQATVLNEWNSALAICTRTLPGGQFTRYRFSSIGASGDSHDFSSIGIDKNGFMHVCYDHHNSALKYRRSNAAINTWTGTLTSTLSMLGTNENVVTYPNFLRHPTTGVLYFFFRDGGPAGGDLFMYAYDADAETWSAAPGTGTGGLLIDGKESSRGVYWDYPKFDGSGNLHLSWIWSRGGPSSFSGIYYAKWDGTSWKKSDGTSQTVPMTHGNSERPIFVTSGEGLINMNDGEADSKGNYHLAYVRDVDSVSQIYHAYFDGTDWHDAPITDTATQWGDDFTKARIIIDRSDDTAVVVFRDTAISNGLVALVSAPGDYNTWSQHVVVYEPDIGLFVPFYDRDQWEFNKGLHFQLPFYFGNVAGQKHATVLETSISAIVEGVARIPRHGVVMLGGVGMV
jgi:hypothetical protein